MLSHYEVKDYYLYQCGAKCIDTYLDVITLSGNGLLPVLGDTIVILHLPGCYHTIRQKS